MNHPQPIIRRPATYQDVLDAPPNMVAELVNGALHVQPRPGLWAALAKTRLGAEIGCQVERGRNGVPGWRLIFEPELHLGNDVLVPDACAWHRDTFPAPLDEVGVRMVPDWVCEVLSPSTRQFDLVEKRQVYGQAGVGHLWFVDPSARTLEAFSNDAGTWALITALKDDDPVSVPPFDAIEFPLSALWTD